MIFLEENIFSYVRTSCTTLFVLESPTGTPGVFRISPFRYPQAPLLTHWDPLANSLDTLGQCIAALKSILNFGYNIFSTYVTPN